MYSEQQINDVRRAIQQLERGQLHARTGLEGYEDAAVLATLRGQLANLERAQANDLEALAPR